MSNFENSLTVDFVHPRAHRGKKAPANLVTSCRPCNIIKGRRMFSSLEEAKAYVLQRRLELQREWEANTARLRSQSAALSLYHPSRPAAQSCSEIRTVAIGNDMQPSKLLG
jgi:hypothetical protein